MGVLLLHEAYDNYMSFYVVIIKQLTDFLGSVQFLKPCQKCTRYVIKPPEWNFIFDNLMHCAILKVPITDKLLVSFFSYLMTPWHRAGEK